MINKIYLAPLFLLVPFFSGADNSYSFQQASYTTLPSVSKLSVSDLNGDNIDDVITLGSKANILINSNALLSLTNSYITIDDKFKVFRTNNPNDFFFSLNYHTPIDFALGDVDGNGITDIVVANRGEPDYITPSTYGAPGGVGVLLGGNNASFLLHQSQQFDYVNDNPKKIKLADIDRDGDLDALVLLDSLYSPRTPIVVLLNDGNGSYSESNRLYLDSASTTQSRVIDFELSDVESDGDIDIVVTHNQEFRVYKNDGTGLFTQFAGYSNLQSNKANSIGRIIISKMIDYDEDGDDDAVFLMNVSKLVNPLLISSTYDNRSTIFQLGYYRNNGSGAFDFLEGELVPLIGVVDLLVSDINSDGHKDIIISGLSAVTYSSSDTYLFKGNGLNTQFFPEKILTNFSSRNNGANLTRQKSINLNSDSKSDLIAIDNYGVLYSFSQFEKGTNTSPSIAVLGNKITTENQILSFVVVATDAESNPISLSVTNLPSGAEFSSSKGEFVWTPSYNASGTYEVSFTATEDSPNSLSDTKTVAITVTNTNRAPVISPIGNKTVNEGNDLNFIVSASDPDGDTLNLIALNLPVGSTFNQNTGEFLWATSFNDAGSYQNIEFLATDNSTPTKSVNELITVTVNNVNRTPVISNPGTQLITENQVLSFIINANDPDNDSLELSATNLPPGAIFNTTTGLFSWVTNQSNAGVYSVTFSATDNGLPSMVASITVAMTVLDYPTQIEQIRNLVDLVNSLSVATNIKNSYLANLKKVEELILDNKTTPALNQLQSFKNKVNQDFTQGVITQAQKFTLIAAADILIAELNK